jgi:NitT/TauT family transport system substrate-binding protein
MKRSPAIHVGSGGIAPMVTAWDRTRGNLSIQGIGVLCARHLLVSVYKYHGFGPGSSPWPVRASRSRRSTSDGIGQGVRHRRAQLNPLFVHLSHPDEHGAAFGQQIRPHSWRLHSNTAPSRRHAQGAELLRRDGGPASFLSVWSTSKFRAEPDRVQGRGRRVPRATDLINTNRRRAAEIYIADGSKESVEDVEKRLTDPDFMFDLAPKLIKLTDFMNAAGVIENESRPPGRCSFGSAARH